MSKKIIIWASLTLIVIAALVSLEMNVYFQDRSPVTATSTNNQVEEEKPLEKITYTNATSDMITVELPFPGAVTGKEFSIIGKARGTWYFEASFPVVILDANGKVLVSVPAQAQSDWMTTDFVPFKATITVPLSYIGKATIVLKNDNPSGLPEKDASISFPITIEY
jgi:hypothetical protein